MEANKTASDNKCLVALGSYDGNLFGIRVKVNPHHEEDDNEDLSNHDSIGFWTKTKFAFNAFEGSIRTMDNNGKYLAIGGFEEVIKIFDLNRNIEIGELVDHKGTITHLQFFKNSYLLSGSEDGDIYIWRVKDWSLIYQLRQKKVGSVVNFAIHPSGKLCMAIYKSSSFILWDLTKGKLKFKKKVREDVISLKWNQAGTHYLILFHKSIAVYSIAQDKPVSIINFDQKLCDFGWIAAPKLLNDTDSQASECIQSDDILFVLSDLNTVFYVTQYQEQSPLVKSLETGLARHRSLAVHPMLNDNLIAILDSSGCLSFTMASKIIKKVNGIDEESKNSGLDSDEGEGESEDESNIIEFDKQIPSRHRLLTLSISSIKKTVTMPQHKKTKVAKIAKKSKKAAK